MIKLRSCFSLKPFPIIFLFIFSAIFLSIFLQVSRAENLCDEIPKGKLGYRLGVYLTIEGIRMERGKVGTRTLLVDTVNGKKLETPIATWIDNIKDPGIPEGEKCILRGYESGKMIGMPEEVIKAEHVSQPQAGWQFFRYFIITSVVQPASVVIK